MDDEYNCHNRENHFKWIYPKYKGPFLQVLLYFWVSKKFEHHSLSISENIDLEKRDYALKVLFLKTLPEWMCQRMPKITEIGRKTILTHFYHFEQNKVKKTEKAQYISFLERSNQICWNTSCDLTTLFNQSFRKTIWRQWNWC